MNPEFLTVEDVLDIHTLQLERYGGAGGVRDLGLLESAVAQPQASAGGEFLHEDLLVMAATYLFHLVGNHPFIDGNKRTGLLAALVFLEINDVSIKHDSETLYDLTLAVASGQADKAKVVTTLRRVAGRV